MSDESENSTLDGSERQVVLQASERLRYGLDPGGETLFESPSVGEVYSPPRVTARASRNSKTI